MGIKLEVNYSYKKDWIFYCNTSAIQSPAYRFYHEIKCLNENSNRNYLLFKWFKCKAK